MAVFFTSDTHFGHKRTLELSRRPFADVHEMNEAIVDRWNGVVGKSDVVFHLGDFGDVNFIQSLNGLIHLLPGNYDDETTIAALSYYCEEIILPNYLIHNGEVFLQLVHEPDEAVDKGHFFLFGHIHKVQMVKRNGLNVGTDCHDFCPIMLDTVLWYKNAIENHYDDNVFMPELTEQQKS